MDVIIHITALITYLPTIFIGIARQILMLGRISASSNENIEMYRETDKKKKNDWDSIKILFI